MQCFLDNTVDIGKLAFKQEISKIAMSWKDFYLMFYLHYPFRFCNTEAAM